jgi:predicted transcriptional regulator
MDSETFETKKSEEVKKVEKTEINTDTSKKSISDKGTKNNLKNSIPGKNDNNNTKNQKSSKSMDNNSLPHQNSTLPHRITEKNSKNFVAVDKNSAEVSGDIYENVANVAVNFGTKQLEKFNTATFATNSYSIPNTSAENNSKKDKKLKTATENSSTEEEEIEDDDIVIKDNKIIIQTRNKHKFEILYGLAWSIEDSTRLIDLKIPQLPQWVFTAKKKDEVLNIPVVVDFYQMEGKTVYYIRNKKEIVEKLYNFRGERHISKKLISDTLDIWLDRINPSKYIKWVDVREVVKKYKEWEEINQDPLGFFLSRASDVVGNEKLKVAVLLSVVSSQLSKIRRGIYRVHLILTGSSGSGKSSTIKSILDLFYDNADGVEDFIVLKLTRMTREALGRLRVDTLDGKVIFIEQLDNMEGVDYIREAMSEDRITTLTTVKDSEGNLVSKTVVIPGQPAFVTTNVTANVDHQIINRSIQLYLSQTEDEKLKTKIIETILERGDIEEFDRIKLITYVWLKTRPKSPKMTKEVKEELVKLLSKFINFKNIYRATEITRNLVRATASLFSHEEITKEDVDFVMDYFKKDIILTTLELSERDLQLLRWLRDHGFIQGEKEEETKDVTTSEIAQVVKMSTQETKKLLDVLYDKGLVWKAYDGRRFSWAINRYGVRVLEELEKEVEEGQEQEGNGGEIEVLIDDQLLAYISSKLLGKNQVADEELRGILKDVAQATDPEAQDLFITVLVKKGLIKDNGDGTWKVL